MGLGYTREGPRGKRGVTMDSITLSGIRVFGHHGCSEEERSTGQTLEVDVQIRMDLRVPGRSDRLEDTADYAQVFRIVEHVVTGERRSLLESIATDIARRVLEATPAAEVLVRVSKPSPPVGGPCRNSSVEIVRTRADYREAGAS